MNDNFLDKPSALVAISKAVKTYFEIYDADDVSKETLWEWRKTVIR